MKQEDKELPRLQLRALPAAVGETVRSFFEGRYRITDQHGDIVISGDADDAGDAAVPVLHLSADHARPSLTRLSDLVDDMVTAPALYLDPFDIGDAVLKPAQKILQRNGNDIALTDKETDVLIHLARAKGQPLPREVLLHRVWGYGDGIDTHTLETHIYRLRQKTGDDLIVTHDDGYMIG